MATATRKVTLNASRDIPFNKLVLSQSNVRRVKAGISIEQLAEDIAHRSLLQSLNVRAVVTAEGGETGMFEVPAGGRRYQALELLVKQKRMNKTQLVPCIVRTDGIAEEDSLAENVQRAPLHPLDQFRAFQTPAREGSERGGHRGPLFRPFDRREAAAQARRSFPKAPRHICGGRYDA
jgi:ParB family transcriptional regulator, chromosome partitioning protein